MEKPELIAELQKLAEQNRQQEASAETMRDVIRWLVLIIVVMMTVRWIHYGHFLTGHKVIKFWLLEAPLIYLYPFCLFYRKKKWPMGFATWWDSQGMPAVMATALAYWFAVGIFDRF